MRGIKDDRHETRAHPQCASGCNFENTMESRRVKDSQGKIKEKPDRQVLFARKNAQMLAIHAGGERTIKMDGFITP